MAYQAGLVVGCCSSSIQQHSAQIQQCRLYSLCQPAYTIRQQETVEHFSIFTVPCCVCRVYRAIQWVLFRMLVQNSGYNTYIIVMYCLSE
jgi:hypothetical protein